MQEFNPYQLIRYYVSNWALIIFLTALGLIVGLIYNSFIQKPSYRSEATLLLVNNSTIDATPDGTLLNNYVELFKSRRVLEPVIAQQNLQIPYDKLVNSVEATNENGTEVIKVAISTSDPKTSQLLLNGAVTSLKTQVEQLYGKGNVKVVDNANLPTQPHNVKTYLQLILSTIAGLLVSIIFLFFKYDIKLNNGTLNQEVPRKAARTNQSSPLKLISNFLTRLKNNISSKKEKEIKVKTKKSTKSINTAKKKPTTKKATSTKVAKSKKQL